MSRWLLILDSPAARQKAIEWINTAKVGTRVEFKATKRSIPQNDLMWALLTEFAGQFVHNGRKYDPAQWKSIFLHGFGREIDFVPNLKGDNFLPIGMSSSDLSKEEMTKFIEYILSEAAERNITLKIPNQESGDPPTPDVLDAAAASGTAGGDPPTPPATQFSDYRKHLIEFGQKTLRLSQDTSITVATRKTILEGLVMDRWRDQVPEEQWPMLDKLAKAARAVINGFRTKAEAIKYMAEEIGCSPHELEEKK